MDVIVALQKFIDVIAEGTIVFLLSCLPIGELRIGIPYGIAALDMDIMPTLIWAITGNTLAGIFVLLYIDRFVQFLLARSVLLHKYAKKYLDRLHVTHVDRFNKWGAFFLAAFITIPFPGTGAWTAALLAYLFNIPFRLAALSIFVGVAISGIMVASITGLLV